MKATTWLATLCLLYFLLKTPGWAFETDPPTQVQTPDACRSEIAHAIDSAMALGSELGIEVMLVNLANWKKCLPARDTSLGNLYHKTGVLCYVADRYADAVHWFERALEVRRNNPDAPTESLLNTLNGLTQTHLLAFDFDKAEYFIEEQLAVFRAQKQKNYEAEADLYLADGQLAFQREDYVRCREKLRLAANFYPENNPNRGHVFNLSGVVADLLGDPAEALKFYRQAIAVFEKNNLPTEAARCLHNSGVAFSKISQPDSALFFLKKSADVNLAVGNDVEIARHFVEMAKVHASQKNQAAALEFAQKSRSLRDALLPDWHPDVLESQVFLGQTLLQFNRETEALALFDTAIANAIRSPRPDQVIVPLAEKARFWAQKGRSDPDAARQAHQFYEQLDSLLFFARQQYRQDESKIAFTQTVRDIYENAQRTALQLFETTGQAHFFDRALAYCEHGKSASLRDHLRRRSAQGFAGLPDSILQLEQRLELQVGAKLEALLSAGKLPDSLRFILEHDLEKAKEEQEEFNEQLEAAHPKYFELIYERRKNPTVPELQNSLPSQTLLLEFFEGDSNLFVFAVGKKGFQAWILPEKQAITQNVRQFLLLADGQAEGSDAEFCRAARLVFRQVLEKPLDHFSTLGNVRRLRIVPDGLLATLPFDALLTADAERLDGDTPFLLKKYGVSLLFSNRQLLEAPPERRWFGQPGCSVFGIDYQDTPDFFGEKSPGSAPGFLPSPLPNAAAEAEWVARQTGGEMFLNRQATAANFMRQTQSSELLHVAAHGIFDAENPMLSGLLFSKNSPGDSLPNLLTVAGTYGLRTGAACIFLSACNTGKGQLIESEGVMNFSRALTYAGARSQVMALWSVGDRSTGQIATSFYRHLEAGKSKDEALRLAKLAYLSESPTALGRHPFFWAGTVAFGNVEPLFVPVFWKWMMLAGGLAAVGMLARVAWKWRRRRLV